MKDVATRNSEAFTYNYDLTDPWSHIVEVLEIQTGNFEHHKAMMVGGGRNGVPEVSLVTFTLCVSNASLPLIDLMLRRTVAAPQASKSF